MERSGGGNGNGNGGRRLRDKNYWLSSMDLEAA
jgi:hypothetical protein